MRTTNVPTAIALLPFFCGQVANAQVFSNDTEPNNTIATAIAINLGTAYEGRLNDGQGDGVDLYLINVPDGGHLDVTVECEQSSSGGPPVTVHPVQLDSAVGLSMMAAPLGAFGSVQTTVSRLWCLGAGDQLIQVSNSPGPECSYRITAQFAPMAFSGDPEPNEDLATATILTEGAAATGHLSVGWPHNGPTWDHWRIDKAIAGPITFFTAFVSSDQTADGFELFDILTANGQSAGPQIYSATVGLNGVAIEDTVVVFDQMDQPGTYYLRFADLASPCIAYRLSWSTGVVGIQEPSEGGQLSSTVSGDALRLSLANGKFNHVMLFDASGRMAVQWRMAPTSEYIFDLSGLATGSYSALVVTTDGQRVPLRFVIGN